MSASLMVPFELEYMKLLQLMGWNSAAVMTSVSSSMLTGFMSTISGGKGTVRRMDQVKRFGQALTEALVTNIKIPQVDP